MSYATILVTRVDSILQIKLNRSDALNAINVKMADELSQVVDEVNRDEDVRAVVLCGEGKAFCAGGDVSLLQGFSQMSEPEIRDHVFELEKKLGRIAFIEKVVVASIHGYALGAGLSLAMLCDLRIAAESATLGMEFINMAIIPEVGARLTLPRLVGSGKALELAITGDRIAGREAERIGLVHRAVADDELESVTSHMAGRLAEKAPVAVRLTKKSLQEDLRRHLLGAFQYEASANAGRYLSEDFREAANAFREKRKPVFRGK
jgi:enoyl-CoA hydratase/carnithine racemase